MLGERNDRARLALTALRTAAGQVRDTNIRQAEEILDAVVAAAVDLAEAMAAAAVSADLVDSARLSIRRVLDELPESAPVNVRLNPADHAELIAAGTGELAPGMAVTLVPDRAIERGGAVAQTAVTTVDATLSAAVRRVRAELSQ
jgi:flagellar assembly protein FliH